jgi:endonuclease/exonuclease/phosphatase family metal-dependent hydrolase
MESKPTLKIANYNLQACVKTTKGYAQYISSCWKYFLPHSPDAIYKTADFINSENIDIMTFSEIDARSLRSKAIDQAELISNLTSLKENSFFSTYSFSKLIHQGNLINTKHPILSSTLYKLPGNRRSLGKSIIKINDKTITVYITHLSLSKKLRKKQITLIIEIIEDTQGPIILTGDFNAEKDEIMLLSKKLNKIDTEPTFPSWNPKRCIDHIFISKEFMLIKSYIPDNVKLSDHLPIVSELCLIN